MNADGNMAAAVAYAERLGWPVFPLRGKVPVIPNEEKGGRGHVDATTHAETIVSFWKRYPRSNVGVSCIATGHRARVGAWTWHNVAMRSGRVGAGACAAVRRSG